MSRAVLPLVVIGAGPAGVAAAVEARRAGLPVVLLDETGVAGGGIVVAHEVRNVPFLPGSVSGARVSAEIAVFAQRWGLEVAAERVVQIDQVEGGLDVVAASSHRWHACGAVIATGASALLPAVDGLPDRVEPPWACSAPDAWRGGATRRVAIIGASDVAFDQARWLRARGVAATILCRGSVPRAPSWLFEAARRDGVELRLLTRAVRAFTSGGDVVLELESPCGRSELAVDTVLPAVGRAPRWKESIAIDEAAMAYVRIAGDALGRRSRHVSVALGDGCLATAELLARMTEGTSQ